ncbi:MAG: hypothetical protein H6830_12080 [Planctomycetes bacterium]|nr:hypothetical protein [Planctomycetota bacterium]MCB9910818.1 hypothetical protein [Planctomycetota bacterium]
MLRRSSDSHASYSDTTLARIHPDELGYFYRRSLAIYVFAAAMGLAFVVLLAVVAVGASAGAAQVASIPGLGSYATVAFFGLAALGAYLRSGWGRWAGMAIALVCLGQVAWYMADLNHWKLSLEGVPTAVRMFLGWLGGVGFFGTDPLFGRDGVGHRELKEAYQAERQLQEDLARVHAMDQRSHRDRAA